MPRLECACKAIEVIAKHSIKCFRELILDQRPVFLKIFVPLEERLMIIRSEIMPIFHDEESFTCLSELFDRWQHPAWKNQLPPPKAVV